MSEFWFWICSSHLPWIYFCSLLLKFKNIVFMFVGGNIFFQVQKILNVIEICVAKMKKLINTCKMSLRLLSLYSKVKVVKVFSKFVHITLRFWLRTGNKTWIVDLGCFSHKMGDVIDGRPHTRKTWWLMWEKKLICNFQWMLYTLKQILYV